ncbi:hypothetical protein N008_01045 [Hymenobacter sp. APR13]|nr:hypothetical protein N008_01045 [Hymenobacter sp. APR13]
MLRQKYSHKKATEMYLAGASPESVAKMLLEEGASEQEAPQLAAEYLRSFLLYQVDIQKKLLKRGSLFQTIGLVFTICGLVLSFLASISTDTNGSNIIFYGIILSGIGIWVKGFIDKRQSSDIISQVENSLASAEIYRAS